MLIYAPFTPDQVEGLNEYQRSGIMHPFTCRQCRRTLVASEGGWYCTDDDYTQDWAHEFMANGAWKI